ESAGKDYDLTSDIYSQVYSGMAAERYRINKAVDETKGLILVYQGKVFPAFYHATCAGHTEDASRLWNINIAPLTGVACGFCKESPHFNWHYVLSLKEINDKLEKAGFKINNIKDILILGRDDSGRITDLKILSAEREVKISAKDFRETIGPNIIKSTNFNLSIAGTDVIFEGLGWGHGVGLCQWGSYFMAKQGYGYEEILAYYYPGALISQLN
ncbi:MAG: SpoIID/LytB domain-containing protein, partial [Candidatus Omnitrophica bacterium]|nr:SpoIID/LytB domain-containing protein [Candidatus Omnitrophota bacterium]